MTATILNALCSHIVHFDHLRLETYSGNYDTFSRTRAARRELLAKQHEKQECSGGICNPLLTVSAIRPAKPKQAQSRIKML